jgi:hypothetical protein
MNVEEYLKDFTDQQKEEFWASRNKAEQVRQQFMNQYKEDHACCPKCGELSCRATLMGYVFNSNSPHTYKNLNRCTCVTCGDMHTKHDRVPKAMRI